MVTTLGALLGLVSLGYFWYVIAGLTLLTTLPWYAWTIIGVRAFFDLVRVAKLSAKGIEAKS